MWKKTLLAGAVVAALAAPSATARPDPLAQPQTTEPGIVYPVQVDVTDRKITIRYRRYVRGAIILYKIRNNGSRPYKFVIIGIPSQVIRPGGRDSLLINWNARGRFSYYTVFKGRPTGVRGTITIY